VAVDHARPLRDVRLVLHLHGSGDDDHGDDDHHGADDGRATGEAGVDTCAEATDDSRADSDADSDSHADPHSACGSDDAGCAAAAGPAGSA
jgi:hypothetical protein